MMRRIMGAVCSSSAGTDGSENQSPGFLMNATIKSIGLKFSSVKNISTSTLDSWLATTDQKNLAVLDCRPEEEYFISHIKGAIEAGYQSRSVEELVEMCEEILKGKPDPIIVCYCSVGYRSADIAQDLTKSYDKSGKQPRPEIFNLEGSLFKWASEERPMVDKNEQSTPYVHPYNDVWGKLVDKRLIKRHPEE